MSGAVRETTKYFDFEIPQFDFPGWHVYYDRNIKTVDTILYLMTGTDSLKGIWKNNELYNVGDRVVDVDVAFAFECFVQHTSSPAPTTFAQDRTAHPNYWHAIDFIQALSGTSNTAVAIGLDTKVFQTQTGRIFNPGGKIIINSAANPTVDYMWGAIVSYTENTLTVDVDVASGSGTHSDWLLSVSGERGATGPIGPVGIQGPIGETGAQGPQGEVGPQGIIEEPPVNAATYGRTYDGVDGAWIPVAVTNAATLPIVPAGGISSTNMQNAIYELDTEKVAKAGDTMTGAMTFTKTGHWSYSTPGAGTYYSTSTVTDRFFLGTGDASPDTLRIWSAGTGTNALIVDGATGKITVTPPTSDLHIATKKYVDDLTAFVVDITGDVMTGPLTVPSLTINHANNSDLWYQIGGQARWLVRCEPGGDMNWHHYNDAGTYLGSILTLQRLTNDAVFQHDVVANNSLKSSGGIAIGSNVTTGMMSDGANLLVRAVGGNPIYMQYANGAANYAYFANGSSRIFGGLTVDASLAVGNNIDANVIQSHWSDGIRCTVPSYWHARFYTTVEGVRSWAVGTVNWGSFGIWDESAGRQCMIIDTNGNTGFAANVNAPTFSGTFNGTLNGNVNGSCTGNAGGLQTDGGIKVGWIEGPQAMDMKTIGSASDYDFRFMVNYPHLDVTTLAGLGNHVKFHTNIEVIDGGTVYCPNGYHSTIGGDTGAYTWTFNWGDASGGFAVRIGGVYVANMGLVSDYRIKKDIRLLDSMWDRVKSLKPISYKHREYTPPELEEAAKKEGRPFIADDGIERWGFSAHELQSSLVKSAATGEKDQKGMVQSPDPFPIIAALTKALQEAMSRIESLEAKLATAK